MPAVPGPGRPEGTSLLDSAPFFGNYSVPHLCFCASSPALSLASPSLLLSHTYIQVNSFRIGSQQYKSRAMAAETTANFFGVFCFKKTKANLAGSKKQKHVHAHTRCSGELVLSD